MPGKERRRKIIPAFSCVRRILRDIFLLMHCWMHGINVHCHGHFRAPANALIIEKYVRVRAGHKVLFFSLFTWSRTHRKKKGNNCPGSYVKRKKRKELAVETPTFGWNHINFLFLSIHNVGATASHWPERWNCATNVCDLVASFYLSLGQWASDSEQVVTRVRGVGRKHVADHFSYFLFLWPAPKLLYAGQ